MSHITNMPPMPMAALPAWLVAGSPPFTLTLVETNQFRAMWRASGHLRDQGKLVYYLPYSMGVKITMPAMIMMADRMRLLGQADVFIHLDRRNMAFRIGQVVDQRDYNSVSRLVLGGYSNFNTMTAPVEPSTLVAPLPPVNGSALVAPLAPVDPASSSAPRPAQSYPNRAARRQAQKASKIPKPRNSWIIYRLDHSKLAASANPEMKTANLSKVIAAMWKAERPEVREQYKQRAEQEKRAHALLYPDYKCEPRKSSEIKRRNQKNKIKLVSTSTPEHWQNIDETQALVAAGSVDPTVFDIAADATNFLSDDIFGADVAESATFGESAAFDVAADTTDFLADIEFTADALIDFNFDIASDVGTFLTEGQLDASSLDYSSAEIEQMADYMGVSVEDGDLPLEEYAALYRDPSDLPEVPESLWGMF